ncbi:MAG: hypothetical protein HRU43_00260 [Simkaniaceae bacterium]|nr:hypothetical protein [Simkaniaceae bacterium]
MDFFKKHKLPLIVGVSCFGIGYVTGGIMEARSMQQEFAQNIMNQVTGQQTRMKESRLSDEINTVAINQKTLSGQLHSLNESVLKTGTRTRDLEFKVEDLERQLKNLQKVSRALSDQKYKGHLKEKDDEPLFMKMKKSS